MSKATAIIYFMPADAANAKEIASAIRNQGNLANLVYATNFHDEQDCVSAEAVSIQVDAGNAAKIGSCYRKSFPETEVHFFNSDGEFVDPPEIQEKAKIAMPVVGSKVTDVDKSEEKEASTEVAPVETPEVKSEAAANENANENKTDPSASEEKAGDTNSAAAETAEPTEPAKGNASGAKASQSK